MGFSPLSQNIILSHMKLVLLPLETYFSVFKGGFLAIGEVMFSFLLP